MASIEIVAAGALEGCEVHQLRCCQEVDGDDGLDIRLSVAPPLEGDDGDAENEDRPYTIYVLDAEPCMFALVVCVVRSLHFYKKVQAGGHFPQIVVVGVSHARLVTDDRSWWWKKLNGAVEQVANILPDSITDQIEGISEKVVEMLPDALTPNMSTSTEPVGDPEPVEDHWARLRRQRKRDFTPPARGDSPDPEKWNKAALRGQAPAFLSALEKDVIPFVEKRFNTHPQPERRCLVGSSLSALLACQAMLQGSAFGSVVLGSPSVWWDDQILLEMVGACEPAGPGVDVLITIGSQESERMIAGAKQLQEALEGKSGGGAAAAAWRTTHVVLQGEDHHTCKAALAGTLVRWLVTTWGHQPSAGELADEPSL